MAFGLIFKLIGGFLFVQFRSLPLSKHLTELSINSNRVFSLPEIGFNLGGKVVFVSVNTNEQFACRFTAARGVIKRPKY